MADLSLFPVPLYDPLHPYHWEFDNLPLQTLMRRDEVINGELERCSQILRDAIGTQGTLSNRLDQSIEADGDLKTTAVDDALHSIAKHLDGSQTLTTEEIDAFAELGYTLSNPVPFVRMLNAERAKLALVADQATNMTVQVETPSNIVLFEEGPVTLGQSATVSWEVETGNVIKAHLGFPVEAAHRHYYDLEPITEDYQNYEVNSVSTAFVEGSLRVFVNGVRLSESASVYHPGDLTTDDWTLNSFTADAEAGTFVLTVAVTEDDVVRIDFDILLS